MISGIEEIKPIEVGGQQFLITVLFVSWKYERERMKIHKDNTTLENSYNAYVYLPYLTNEIFKESLGNETFRRENVIGVDTQHLYNTGQSKEEKKADAYRQITRIIEIYVSMLSDVRNAVKLKGE